MRVGPGLGFRRGSARLCVDVRTSRSEQILRVNSSHGRATLRSCSLWMMRGEGPIGSVLPPRPGTNFSTMLACAGERALARADVDGQAPTLRSRLCERARGGGGSAEQLCAHLTGGDHVAKVEGGGYFFRREVGNRAEEDVVRLGDEDVADSARRGESACSGARRTRRARARATHSSSIRSRWPCSTNWTIEEGRLTTG